jgi:hypothetical protein
MNRYIGPKDIQVGSWHESIDKIRDFNMKFLIDLIHPKVILNKSTCAKVIEALKREIGLLEGINRIHKERYNNFKKPGHESATEIRKNFPYEWKNYLKFCFVRNPYEKAVSDYLWRTSGERRSVTFEEFIQLVYEYKLIGCERNSIVPKVPTNWELYTINDRVAVDYVGKLEDMKSDLREICHYIGLEFDVDKIPWEKKSKVNNSYKKFYNQRSKKMVSEIYANEIEKFGYEFPQ